MKKILLLDTAVATLNMGDEIIGQSIRRQLDGLFRNHYMITLPSHTPLYTTWQQLLYPGNMKVYAHADLKFLCGTNALYTNMLRPLPQWNIHLGNHRLVQNTICLGVGLGCKSKKVNLYTKRLYRNVLSRQYAHSVRDDETKQFLERLGYQAWNTGCPTLWSLTPAHCKNIPTAKSDRVVFTLTHYMADEQNDQKMIEILQNNYREIYFWPQCFEDLSYLKCLGKDKGVTILPPNLRAYDELLRTEIDYVGNRLHGGIFALQHKRRSIILSIDYRAENMSRTYSIPILKRENVSDLLERKIRSSFETSILGLDFELIERWKEQFMDDEDTFS